MTNKIPAGIKPKEPLWTPTHIYLGGEKLVFFPIGEELIYVSGSEFDGAYIYSNENGTKQHIYNTDVKEL